MSGCSQYECDLFFQDDSWQETELSTGGAIFEIRIWIRLVLSAFDIPSAFAPIPEPSAFFLLIGGSSLVFAEKRRRYQKMLEFKFLLVLWGRSFILEG